MINPTYEVIETDQSGKLRCSHNACDRFADEHPLHFHPFFELTWILRSSGTRYVGGSVAPYDAGDLVLSGPNLPHCWRDDPITGDDRGPEWIIAQFDPACFGEGLLELPGAEKLREMLDDASAGLAFGADAAARVGDMLHDLVKRSGFARVVKLLDILETLSHHSRTPIAPRSCNASREAGPLLIERLDRVQRYVVENLAGEISQASIAAQLGMKPAAFSKFFRATTGRTFMSLVKTLRVNEACRLLATTEARITDVALDCGYSHTSYFDQQFLEVKGMSPSAYRRSLAGLG